ncbi:MULTISPECIES: cupin domain-containing protein [unclassified Rhizobium]|uniref:cupin domain-containing protein n=1 Tax=unclassified Rhizobium TaxID=2613769 RepID=UPI000EAA82B0|nr:MULTISPECIES: cupin domain-containing protein [unclassified Rhizobium]AYG67494.1 cupin domain-containing protein [Rhizobium sp. CCGE531]AYG73888.1 cupin domain-containing protein [Rhizobium sp. CCGE532]
MIYTLPENLEWIEVAPGNRRAILSERPELMLAAFRFEEGGISPLHSHMHTQVSYVAEGTFDVTVDGQTVRLGPGSSFIVAPHLVHGVVAVTQGLLIDTFNPRRDDFLQKQ